MDKEKMAEAIAVNISVAKGYCDRCKYNNRCESNRRFVLPIDAICTITKNKIIKTLYEGENDG